MDADERNSMAYIYLAHNAPSGHKGHTTMERYEVPPRLSISIQNQYGVSRRCVNTKRPGACSPEQPWPTLQLVLVPKPTKGLENREQVLPSIPCPLKTPNQPPPPPRFGGVGLALRLPSARVCESNISKCRPIPRGTFESRIRRFETGTCHGFLALCFSRLLTNLSDSFFNKREDRC